MVAFSYGSTGVLGGAVRFYSNEEESIESPEEIERKSAMSGRWKAMILGGEFGSLSAVSEEKP